MGSARPFGARSHVGPVVELERDRVDTEALTAVRAIREDVSERTSQVAHVTSVRWMNWL
jgi:hypothetical protein